MRILAVDDDPVVRELLATALGTKERYDLTCASSGEEALQIVKDTPRPFECFLLDVMMPGIDGIELCDRLRQSKAHRTTPIIMITASREPDLMGRAFYAGATDFVTKPFNGVELGARINAAAILSDTLLREREARHTLAELTAQTRIRFDEGFEMPDLGITDLSGLENRLLRLPAGVFTMELLCFEVLGLRSLHGAVTGDVFRRQLENIGKAIMQGLEGQNTLVGYAGGGRFGGVLMARRRGVREDLLARINARLAETWEAEATGMAMPPAIRLTSLSDQRLWSGRSASDQFHKLRRRADVFAAQGEADEDRLFKRLAEQAD